MRILVTGAFGYLGLAVLRALAPRHEVVAFGHEPRHEGARRIIPPNITPVFGDILRVEQALAGHGRMNAVIHLAGGGGPRRCDADPVEAVQSNVRGTQAVAEATRGARLIFASTIQVYGTHRIPAGPYEERDGEAPDDLYGAVKAAAEWICFTTGAGVALRVANIYGAGIGVDMGIQGAAERFARAAATGGELTLFGGGTQKIDYVHVDDVVDAISRAVERPLPSGPINIGGGAPIAIGDLAQMCAAAGEALGARPRMVHKPAPVGKVWPDRSLAIERAAELLDWRPARRLEDGVRELVTMMKGSEAVA